MLDSTDNIKNNYYSMQSGTFASKINNKADGYKKGAIVGALAGVVCAILFKGKIVLWTVVGAVGGGFLGYKIAENIEQQPEFINGEK
jgi:uncharacterized protein YcfJ